MTLLSAQSPQTAAQAMVSIRNLTKIYHTRRGELMALKNVSLDIRTGEVLVLLGPSGCGKTTLLRSVAGLEEPTSGEIVVNGRTVYSSSQNLSLPPERRNLSMVFQSYALWPHMTVADNVGYPLKISKVRPEEVRERVEKVLKLAGLDRFGSNFPGQLSGGQQQRVALARALVANDGLILFDEPLSNLDAKVRERLRDELITMQQEFGFTAIYVTHDQVEAAALASRIAVMEVGAVAQLGAPEQIFNEPQTRYVADFVGCVNEIAGKVLGRAGECLSVDTPLGRLNAIPASPAAAEGGEAILMFRPEHGHFVDPAAEGENIIRGKVDRGIFLGSHVEYRLDVGGTSLAVRSMSEAQLSPGTDVAIRIDPRALRAFPAQ